MRRRVLTSNEAGKLALWVMPDCKADYVFPNFGEGLCAQRQSGHPRPPLKRIIPNL